MNAAVWQRVEEIFHAALERPAAEREAFLDAACRDDAGDFDPVLHDEVESLLGALDGPDAFDESAASRLASHLADEEEREDEAPEQHIGRYRLLEVLGQGGMGTVYLAEQSEPLQRRVALKLMSWRGEPGEALRRFELEREAMARMSHPTIAQVFDAGTTERGQPYVVLEYIPGSPITEYCDTRDLDLRQRMVLLLSVCEGVRHAHEKAVIHRDLKPSNILVAETADSPLAKIIDFGIAKALEPWRTTDSPTTHSGLRVGSPSYMSPEALATGGRRLDTRSDVYSLGVVLCELLAGVRPFSHPLKQFMLHGSEPSRLEGLLDAARPSRRLLTRAADERQEIARRRGLDEAKLLRHLRDELDWIVLRAIAPDPERRYSVAELAADIRRWLDGEPIEAHPPSLAYRARKTVRRHAVLVVAAGLLAATVLGFSIRSSILYQRAEAARVQAEELVTFMLDDLSTQLEPMGRLDLLESVSRESLDYFESASGEGLQAAGRQPAAALRQIGRVLASRGDVDAAYEAYERARRIDLNRLRRMPGDASVVLDLANDLSLLAKLHEERGELQLAAERHHEAEERMRTLVAAEPRNEAALLALADTLTGSGGIYRLLGDSEAAVRSLEESLEITDGLLRRVPDAPRVLHTVGSARYTLGLLTLFSLDDPRTAAEHLEAGVTVYRKLAENQPEASLWRFRLAVLLGQGLTTAYTELGRDDAARAANREALQLYQLLVREDPTNGRWAHALGWEQIRRGMLATDSGDLVEATEAFRSAVEVQQELVARTVGPQVTWVEGLATARLALAETLAARGDVAAALDAADAALATRRSVTGDTPTHAYWLGDHGDVLILVAELRARRGEADAARAAIRELEAMHEELEASDFEEPYVDDQLAEQRERLAQLRETLGDGSDG